MCTLSCWPTQKAVLRRNGWGNPSARSRSMSTADVGLLVFRIQRGLDQEVAASKRVQLPRAGTPHSRCCIFGGCHRLEVLI